MEITQQGWEVLSRHLVDTQGNRPPRAVYGTVAALIGDADLDVAVTVYEPRDGQTDWSVFAVAGGALVYVAVLFDADLYTFAEEDEPVYSSHPAKVTLRAAWARPLSEVVEFNLLSVGTVPRTEPSSWYPVQASIRFRGQDRSVVVLPGQVRLHRPEERKPVDDLLSAVRRAVVVAD